MRPRPYNVLVLDDDHAALHQMVELLKERDYAVNFAKDLEQARWWLSLRPIDLVVAAARMRGMGGVQFIAAARTQHPELAGIVMGNRGDEALEMEAWRHRVTLIIRPCEPARLLMVVAETLASIRRRQRWPRKNLQSSVPLKVAGAEATLMNVSYGGLGFAFEGETFDLPSPMTIEVSPVPVTVTAELVWSTRTSDGASCVCGAAIVGDAPPPEWRQFVDRLPQRA